MAMPSQTSIDPKHPEAAAPATAAPPLAVRAIVFCYAWSAYLFIHHSMVYWAWFRFRGANDRPDPVGLAIGVTLWVVGAIALLRPGSLRWFVALLVCNLVYELPALPKTANHTFLTICMNVTMLAVVGVYALRRRLRDFFPAMAALLRLEVLAMYFFVVLHKLNRDYFDPAYSCATELYADIVKLYPIFPSGAWTDPLCVYGAIGFEAIIPLLLVFRRTRVLGVGLGLLFHLMLAPHPNAFIYSYSTLLYAAYFLFLPDDVLREMMNQWGALLRGLRRRWAWFALPAVALGSSVVLLRIVAPDFVRGVKLIDHAHVLIAAGVRFVWTLAALFNIFAFARAVWRCRGPKESPVPSQASEPFFRPALSPLLVFPLLVTFNGLCPYLGLKTESAFAMYSNLRTEGTVNNHLFMPRVNLANYQDDLVDVIDSSDGQLRNLRRDGYQWTYLEFRRRLSRIRSDKFWVTYKRNGVEHTLRRATDKTNEAFTPLPWLERELLFFRAVQLGDTPQRCGH